LKYLAEIVKYIRQGIIEGFKISRDDASRLPLELVEETSSVHVEIYSSKVYEIPLRKTSKLERVIYALDSSTRVVETPYLFISIGAGSVFSRLTGFALDAPSLLSILGLEEPLCRHIVLIPEIEYSREFAELLRSSKSIMYTNPNNTPYTSEYNRNMVLAELRASLENCLLENFARMTKGIEALFIDGPVVYPEKIVETTPASRGQLEVYTSSIRALNTRRIELINKLLAENTLVLNIVKRLHRSYYLSATDPLDLKTSSVSDDVYLTLALISGKIPREKPVAIGPLLVKHRGGLYVNRTMWYLVIPRRIHVGPEKLGNYVFYRVEVSGENTGESTIDLIIHDSLLMGSFLPLTLLIVDKRVKRLSSSITTYFLYVTGLSSEATEHYISIF